MGRGNRRGHKRKPAYCTKCKLPVKGHVGRPGKECKNITTEDSFTRTANENDISTPVRVSRDEMATGNVNNNPSGSQENADENLTMNEICSISRGLQNIVGELSNQMKDMRAEMVELRRSRHRSSSRPRDGSRSSTRSHVPPRSRSSPPQNRSRRSECEWGDPPTLELNTPLREVVSQKDRPETVQNGTGIQPLGGARQRTVPGLKPIEGNFDFYSLPLIGGITEKVVRSALQGDFVELDNFLENVSVYVESDTYQSSNNDNDSTKFRRGKRTVYNFSSWSEAWEHYTRIMTNFHGIQIFNIMSRYKVKIIEWERKHVWKVLQMFDLHHRTRLAMNLSIDFMDIDVLMVNGILDRDSLKVHAQRCPWCYSYNHTSKGCPFQGAPGSNPGATGRTGGLGIPIKDQFCYAWNDYRCADPGCLRRHRCRGCGGESPFSTCQQTGKCKPSQPASVPNHQLNAYQTRFAHPQPRY